ncbi:MAG: Lsr2 family protein [Acidimicrobiales bacterium]
MAQKVEVVLTCDLDDNDTPAVDTVVFGYDGASYEFELCQSHLDKYHQVMQGFVGSARRAGNAGRRSGANSAGRGGRAAGNPSELAQVREWARNNGYEVNDRGRIPAQVREAFDNAQR